MPRATYNLQWLNGNSQRSYPLASDATKRDETDSFSIPDDFILGIYLPIHAGLNVQPGKFFVRSIGIFGAGFRVTVAYDDGSDNPPVVATAVIPKATHVENADYAMPGQGDFEDTRGRIVIGRLDSITSTAPGEYKFTLAAARLEADAIQPMIQYVSGLVIVNGGERSTRLTGDIELIAGTNIKYTVTDAETSNPKIRIDAIDGAGLTSDCSCDELVGDPIRTINGIPPDTSGNFTFLGGDCVEIDSIANGLKFTDTCSKPCCGCQELEALTREMEFFGTEVTTIRGFVNDLHSQVTNMANVVLGSTLNDDSCLSCTTQ